MGKASLEAVWDGVALEVLHARSVDLGTCHLGGVRFVSDEGNTMGMRPRMR